MKIKALILVYEFPPYTSVGGQRPNSWFKYFKENNIEPIIITRQWDNLYNNELDYVAPSKSKYNVIEKKNLGTILKAPYKPNLANRILLKYGDQKFKYLRKLISAYYYPRRGSVELMQKLFFILEKLNIEVLKNTEVKKIKLNEEDAIVTLGNNEQINCKEVVAASHSELGEVHYQDKVEIIKNNRENFNFNIHILIEGISNRAFSYIHVFGNEHLIRLGDLSFQLNKGSNNMLIFVQITSQLFKKFGESEKTVQVALDELKNQQLIPSDAKLLKYKFSNYKCQYRNFEETSLVEKKLGPLVRFVNTINLTYSIRRELDRWTELDKNNVIKSFN